MSCGEDYEVKKEIPEEQEKPGESFSSNLALVNHAILEHNETCTTGSNELSMVEQTHINYYDMIITAKLEIDEDEVSINKLEELTASTPLHIISSYSKDVNDIVIKSKDNSRLERKRIENEDKEDNCEENVGVEENRDMMPMVNSENNLEDNQLVLTQKDTISRAKATSAQLNHMLEFMKVNHDCASGRGSSVQGRVKRERQWQQLKDTLNALGGPVKTVDKWKQTWRDLRNSFKKKALNNRKEFKGAGSDGTVSSPAQLEALSPQHLAVISLRGPVVAYGVEGVPPTMDVKKVVPKSTESGPLMECVTPSAAGVCVASSDLEPTQIPAPPNARTPSMAKAPPRLRIRSRPRIAAPETLHRQILNFEKDRVAVQKSELDMKKKMLELEERRLLIEEAKVKDYERIASALEIFYK